MEFYDDFFESAVLAINFGNWGSGNIFFHFHAQMKESFTPIHIIFMERLASTTYPGGNVVAQSYTPLFSPTLWSH